MPDINQLIAQVNSGDLRARDDLFASAYGELRRLAMSRLYRGGRNTVLDTTALVHESYLRIVKAGSLHWRDRSAFFLYAAQVMRAVIVDAVRQRGAAKRQAGVLRVTLDTAVRDDGAGSDAADAAEVLRVHESLQVLEQAEPLLARVVELRYFGGYSDLEIAEALSVTDRTVRRHWRKARLLLQEMLR